jgi:quercetin dioxygenase-like cupin family protein
MTVATHSEIQMGPMTIRFVLEGSDSGGAVAAFEFNVPVGGKLPVAHSHDAFDETIYGLEGVSRWTVGGTTTDVEPGAAVYVPRGVVHSFDNPHDIEARALAVVTPALLGPDYFRDLVAVVEAAAGGRPDLGAIADVMRSHGLTPAP